MGKTLYYNATVLTMEDTRPRASSVLVEDGIILQVGEDIPLDKDTRPRDLQGAVLLPGFIDPHSHFTAVARRELMVELGNCRTREAVLKTLKQNLPARGWLLAMGYDRVELNRLDLDRVSDSVPVVCTHASGHLAVMNTPALKALGYWGDFSVPGGGTVERLPDGTPSGVLLENAWLDASVQGKIPVPDAKALKHAMEQAGRKYAAYGITTAQDARAGKAELALLGANPPKIDVVCQAVPSAAELRRNNDYVNHVRIGGYKIFLDGSLQGRTAWLTEPYLGSGDCGEAVLSDGEVLRAAKTCLEQGWRLNAHCNGDAACEQLIRCYEQAVAETGIRRDLRPVMIHAQTVREDQLERMAKLGMCASFFLDHVYYWGEDHRKLLLGEKRAKRISPIRTALKLGVHATIHQDAPVVEPNMLFSIHNAVNRMTESGFLLGPDERISVEEALKAVTVSAAWQISEEASKGTVAPGKRADFVILGENPLTAAPEHLKDIQVLETIKDGKTVYRR